MPVANVGEIELFYETVGDADADAEPMLFIMGLGMQLTGWDTSFCRQLAANGFLVIRYDNRDVGLSTKVSGQYGLRDLASDAVGLLDVLHVDRAHVVGASMGAMVAQIIAIEHPDRVRSLVSMMGTTGNRTVGQPSPAAVASFAPPSDDAVVEGIMNISRAIGSPAYALRDRQLRAMVQRDVERSYWPAGVQHQLMAILAAEDRTDALAGVTMPTLVIHGKLDPLVDVSGGIATANAIPNSTLLLVDDMAHDLPAPLWPMLLEAITANARRQ